MKSLSEDQITELAAIDAPTISNAIEKFKLRHPTEGYMGPDIRCMFPEMGGMVGYAVTVTADTSTKDKGQVLLIPEFLRAIEESPKPVILVVKADGERPERTCIIGDLIVGMMKRIGAVGVVTDGCVRDLKAVRNLGFHAFAAGNVVSHGFPSITKVNEPVEISGVVVEPGDLLHADENGVQKIPSECAETLLAAAKKVLEDEKHIVEGLQAEELPQDVREFFYGKCDDGWEK